MDFVGAFPIPQRLVEPLKAALRGERGEWPETLAEREIRTLVEHGVAPLVYAATRHPSLRDEAIRAAALELPRAADVTAVLAALAGRGVEALLMKGTGLAYQLYDAPDLRPRGDTDLLIARDDIAAMREVMLGLGFLESVTSGDEHALRQLLFTRPGGVAYDVHWSATNVPLFAPLLRFETLREQSIAVPVLGPHARTLGLADALLLACVHRVAHHHDSDRLIWLADVVLLRDRMSPHDHRRFWQMALEGGVIGICARSIEAADAWFSRPAHDRAEDWLAAGELARKEPSRVYLDRDMTYGAVILANLRALPWRARVERVWHLAFPPAAFMREAFGTRSRMALPWLYAYRAVRGVIRLFRRAAG